MPKTVLSTFAVRLAALGIAESSSLLAEAIGIIGQPVRAATPQAALRPSMHHSSRPESIRRANRTWPVGWPSVAIDARARRATPLAGKQTNLRPQLVLAVRDRDRERLNWAESATTRDGVVKVTGFTDALDDTPARKRRLRGKCAPLRQCNRASLLVNPPGDEMPLLIEMILDLGVN